MKTKILVLGMLVIILASCVISDGDPETATLVKISNNSSYNLRLSFERVNYSYFYLDDTDVNRNQTGSAGYTVREAITAFDPNFELKFVTFSNLDTNETIAKKPAKGLFVFESGKQFPAQAWTPGSGEKVVYTLKITDKMLE